jgi:hypothetical protein
MKFTIADISRHSSTKSGDKAGSRVKQVMAVGLFLGSLLMGIGLFAATKLIWLPNI